MKTIINSLLLFFVSVFNTFGQEISADYALQVFGFFVYNPDTKNAFLVFGASI